MITSYKKTSPQEPETFSFQFINYALRRLQIGIYADNLSIDWGDGTISDYQLEDNLYGIEYTFKTEGLQKITVTGENIFEVNLSGFGITELQLKHCPALEHLNCSGNELQTLDISHCHLLEELHCNSNNLMELNIPAENQLNLINCSFNNLKKLQLSNCNILQTLYCAHNKLYQLELPECCNVNDLNISHNLLDTDAINKVFRRLSEKNKNDFPMIHYLENPGIEGCDQSIINVKNWI